MAKKIVPYVNVCLMIILLLSFFCYVKDQYALSIFIKHLRSELIIDEDKEITIEELYSMQDYLINVINTRSEGFQNKRPIYGYNINYILKTKTGNCGEGTRLIMNILMRFGIPTRRVYLHGPSELHVVPEVKLSEKWMIIESINGPGEDFKSLLRKLELSVSSYFSTGNYRFHYIPKHEIGSYGFRNFSYWPLNALVNNRLFLTELYIHKPPSQITEYVLENPPLIIVFSSCMLLIIFNIILLKNKRKFNRCNMN